MSHADEIAAARERVVEAARYYAGDDKGGNPYAGEEQLWDAVKELSRAEAATCPECKGDGCSKGSIVSRPVRMEYPPCPACHGSGRRNANEGGM